MYPVTHGRISQKTIGDKYGTFILAISQIFFGVRRSTRGAK